MRALLGILRGMAAIALTGLGLLVVLRGQGAAAHILPGAVLIAAGITVATVGVLIDAVDGRLEDPAPRRR
ncbi:MAG: hypothetical protein IRZ32_01585 [Solirubrobacteraceae bacterium]|nr:hypothetical protein [Solirubrobacteraceae bacterium]